MLRNESGNTDAQVDVEAIMDLPRGAPCDALSPVLRRNFLSSLGVWRSKLFLRALCECNDFDSLGLCGFDDAVDVDTRDVDGVG